MFAVEKVPYHYGPFGADDFTGDYADEAEARKAFVRASMEPRWRVVILWGKSPISRWVVLAQDVKKSEEDES